MKTITIGRSHECDIVIADNSISRIHAELSLVNRQYVYKDISKNGTNIGGRMISNEKVILAPGAKVLLANRIPLPWAQIYTLLPLTGSSLQENTTLYENTPTPSVRDELAIGWGILAFLIPLAGWIMYFCWKAETPHRASQAATWAWIGFGFGLLISLL